MAVSEALFPRPPGIAQAPSSSRSSGSDSLMVSGAGSVSTGCGWDVNVLVCAVGTSPERLTQTNGELTPHPSHFLPPPQETPHVHLLWWDPSSSQLSSISQVENNEARRVAGPGQGHMGADISQAWDLATGQVPC